MIICDYGYWECRAIILLQLEIYVEIYDTKGASELAGILVVGYEECIIEFQNMKKLKRAADI